MSKSTQKPAASLDDQVKAIANINGLYAYDTTAIEWHTESNPKRPSGKAHARFEAYMGAPTVGEYLKRGGTKGDLRYDSEKGFLSLVAE